MRQAPTPGDGNSNGRPETNSPRSWLQSLISRIFGTGSQPAPPAPAALEDRVQEKRRASGKGGARNDSRTSSDRPPRTAERRPARPPRTSPHPGVKSVPIAELPPFQMIASTSELEEAVKTFEPHPRIALDTEADSLHCYFDKLCLLQISVPGTNLLIDPLAEISLAPLFKALEGKTVIIHSADYDLRLLRRCGYTGPTVLFDTMIAARLCGATEFGLAALLHQHFGVTLAKASQKANWAIRPLPQEMLAYAVNDTINLLTLSQIQEARLRELGRWEWFEQMCDKAIRSASVTRERDPDSIWRISGHSDLSERGTAILKALWHWRDQEAQSVDRPAFHILNNDLLLEFSDIFDKGRIPEPRHLRGSRLSRFMEAGQKALALDPSDWPKTIRKPRLRTTQEQEARFKELRKRRDEIASKLSLDPTLIAPKATLEQLSRGESQAVESLLPWQTECLGLHQ